MKIKFFNKNRLLIEFNEQHIRITEVSILSSGAVKIINYGIIFLDNNGFNDNSSVVKADLIRDFLELHNIKTKEVSILLSYMGIISRSIQVPAMSQKDLESHMGLEMNEYIPVSSEEYKFDYKLMELINEQNRDFFNIMVAAVPKSCIEDAVSSIEDNDLGVVNIDILPNVLWRLLARDNTDMVAVEAGRSGMRLMLFKGKNLVLYADNPNNIDIFNNDDFFTLAEEIRGYLNFFSARHFGKSVDLIYLAGEICVNPDALEILGNSLGILVKPSLDRDNLAKNKLISCEEFIASASVYAGNVGLAIREV
ncbi:MAG: pilus assembly protein PilM [Peptococcaceae bacterium]|nr:pilus assembly protein PilM [Peptococcaceae bacterium]